jgi:ribonuclease HI
MSGAQPSQKEKLPPVIEVLEMYTDGACSGNGTNQAVGGVGVFCKTFPYCSVSDPLATTAEHPATNQRAELTAILQALQIAECIDRQQRVGKVIVYTDSTYCKKGVEEWSIKWLANDWKNAKGQPVANQDLWKDVLYYYGLLDDVEFVKVKGHSGDPGNDEADRLAVAGCEMAKQM